MAKFFYKLQNVLDLKLKMEDQAKTVFSSAMAKAAAEEEKLGQLRVKKKNYEDSYRELASGRLKPLELKIAKSCIDNAEEEIKKQTAVLRAAQKNLEVARFRLNEAVKERKIHEKLKEHAFDEFKLELNETEKKEIDELVSYRFNNNGKAGVK
jgi:flagellar FliJ protein